MQEERYIATVDFGSSFISLAVSVVTAQDIKVIYQGKCDSEGIMNGTIVNSRNVANCLKPLIEEAESQLEKRINKLVVNWPRANVKCRTVNCSLERPNPDTPVTKAEIGLLKDTAVEQLTKTLSTSDEIFDILALSYTIDELFQIPEDDIIGTTGDKIEGTFLAFVGQNKAKKNIDMVISGLDGVSVASYCFTPAYASRFVITPEEKEHGVALIELGGSITSVSVYYKGAIRYFRSFMFGGRDITNDIRTEGNMTESLAENVKKGFGSCMPDKLFTMEDKCLQISDSRTGIQSTLQIKYLAEIINSRMNEIANTCLYLLGESGYADKLRCGIVLCGGGAQLLSCHTLFNSLSGLQTKIAIPRYFGSTDDCSHEAMLLSTKDDLSLNCAEETGLHQPEPVRETIVEQSIFNPDEIEVKPDETRKDKERDRKKKKKANFFGSLLDNVGSMFDENYNNLGEDNKNE